MPVEPSAFILFLVAAFTICITPGPDMLYVLANGIKQGPKGGMVAAIGMALGMLVHTAAAALGLAALFKASPLAFMLVRYIGAGYLFWIGVKALREPAFSGKLTEEMPIPMSSILQRALITNLLNPKIVLFYVAFLPQFIHAERGSVIFQFLLLGFSFVILGLLVDSAVGVLGGTLNRILMENLVLSRALNLFSALVFVGLAVRLVVSS